MPKLRIEEPKPKVVEKLNDLDHWRKMAVESSERLSYAETQAKDLRRAADEVRARLTKAKTRLDTANEKVNELNIELVRVSAECDRLRGQVANQERLARKIWECRQAIIEGPLFEVFAELAVSPPEEAGGEQG
jgi:chromosome segregation ATPase